MIDGANGLLGMTCFVQLFSLYFLSFTSGDLAHMSITTYLFYFIGTFLIFNFPSGKIFMGDCGAYFYGFIISFLIISFFGKNPQIPAGNAVLILFYPAFEVLFSVIRKLVSKKNPLYPDLLHLHIKVIRMMKIVYPYNHNDLVAPFLSIIWLSPFLFLVLLNTNTLYIIMSIAFLVIIYIYLYKAIS